MDIQLLVHVYNNQSKKYKKMSSNLLHKKEWCKYNSKNGTL